MNILLVMPHPNPKRSFFSRFQYPSSTLQQIATLTPKEHSVSIIDERYKDVPFITDYDLVGISSLTYNVNRGYEIAKKYQKMGITVVFGGYHASLIPDEVKQHADSVVVGEAELTWPQLLKDVQEGKLKQIYTSPRVVKAEEIPPARHDIGVFTPFAQAVQATRGCPVGCEWCAMNRVEGKTFRARPIEEVIKEMKSIDAKTIFFADASITINPKYTKKLFKEMKKLNKKFECFGNINVVAKDKEFLQLSKEAGVTKWYLGIESISQENIDQAGKSTNKVTDYKKAVQNIKKYGMGVTGFFIFGLDNDTPDIFDKTLQAVEKGSDKSTGEIMIDSGYSPATAKNPTANLIGKDVWKYMLDQIDDKAVITRLYQILQSENESSALKSADIILKLKDKYPTNKLKVMQYDEELESLKEE